MAFLENGLKGRTVHNGTVYGSRVLWQVTARMHLPEVASVPGTGEVERTGRIVTEERCYHYIGPPNEAIMRALWEENMRHTSVSEAVFTPMCTIDGEIAYGHK